MVAFWQVRRGKVAVDTHRNELGQVKTFMEWCREQGRRDAHAAIHSPG
jgi:hypothetical protein